MHVPPPSGGIAAPDPSAATVARLRMLVVDGVIPADQPVAVADVAALLGVSVPDAWVALRELGRDGFLQRAGLDAVRVTAPAPCPSDEVLQIRRLLEPVALRTAAEHVRTVDLLGLRHLAAAVDAALEERDPSAFRRADDAFVAALLALHPNGELARLCIELRARTPVDGMRAPVEHGLLSVHLHPHADLLAAIEADDLDRVEQIAHGVVDRLHYVGVARMDAPHLRAEPIAVDPGTDGEFLEARAEA